MKGEGRDRAVQVAEKISVGAPNTFEGDDLLDLLDDLFPRFAADRSSQKHSYSNEADKTGQHVGDERYFYRNFSSRLPDGEVSDLQVRALLRAVSTGESAEAQDELIQLFRSSPEDTLIAISRRQTSSVDADRLFAFLSRLALLPEINYKSSGAFSIPGHSDLRILAMEVLQRADEAALKSIAERASVADELLLLMVLEREKNPSGSSFYVDWVERQRNEFCKRAEAELRNGPMPFDPVSPTNMWLGYLSSVDKDRALRLLKGLLSIGQWRSDDIASVGPQFHVDPGMPLTLGSLHLNDAFRSDAELMALLLDGDRIPYPEEWDKDPDRVVDGSEVARELGAYVLAKVERDPDYGSTPDDEIEPA